MRRRGQEWRKGKEPGEDKLRNKRARQRERVHGLIPNKSGLDPDKTSHNAVQFLGYHNAWGNHEAC